MRGVQLVFQREMLKIKFPFNTSAGWVQDFKKKHKTRQRHTTKYISTKDSATFEETVKAAELFQKQTVTIILNHSSRSRTCRRC
jgi:hypothetical protein